MRNRLSRSEYPPKSKELEKQFKTLSDLWRAKVAPGDPSIFIGNSVKADVVEKNLGQGKILDKIKINVGAGNAKIEPFKDKVDERYTIYRVKAKNVKNAKKK